MHLFRNAEDERRELAEEDADKEEPVNQQLKEEAARWKKAYEEQYKRANRLEQKLSTLRNEGIGA